MSIWIAPIIVIAVVLSALSLSRLKMPRDPGREGADDRESILAYDRVCHWFLFGIIRYLAINQLKRWRPEGIMMDAGCGPGYMALAITRKFPRLSIIGIDLLRDMIELANDNQSRSRLYARVTFNQANVEELPFESNCLDFAVSTLSLHHWSDPRRAFFEIHRVLKPQGQLLVFDLRRDMPRILFYSIRVCQRLLAPPPIRRVNGGVGSVWSSFTPAEIENLLSLSPFMNWRVQKGWGWAYIWGQKQ